MSFITIIKNLFIEPTLLVKDLKHGKYYCLYDMKRDWKYYFRYDYQTDSDIYSYGYYKYSPKEWVKTFKISEIFFENIVEYLPDNHIDKIIYYRRQRIKSLLKN